MQPYSTAILSYDTLRHPFTAIAAAYLGRLTDLHDPTVARLQVGVFLAVVGGAIAFFLAFAYVFKLFG